MTRIQFGRRSLLLGSLGAAAVLGLGACGRGDGPGGQAADGGMRFYWWGNEKRQANTLKLIEAYQGTVSGLTISPEFADWSAYWDKLATQVAANDAPDVIQMDEKYIREYGGRGALLDLSANGLDTATFAEGTVDTGRTPEGLMGINAGINAPVMIANQKVIEKAGLEVPDDSSWTWEEFADWAAELSGKAGSGTYGVASVIGYDAGFSAFVRQRGKQLFSDTGLAFDAADLTDWYTFGLDLQKAKGSPSASEVAEETGKALDQNMVSLGKVALGPAWSNQVSAYDAASGEDLLPLRLPSTDGSAASAQMWYKASMFYSVSARTADPEGVVKFVNWLVNDPAAGQIGLTERGIPGNTEVRAAIEPELGASDKKISEFIASLASEVGAVPPSPPIGAGTFADVLTRYGQDVAFERTTPAAAAEALITEVQGNLKS